MIDAGNVVGEYAHRGVRIEELTVSEVVALIQYRKEHADDTDSGTQTPPGFTL